MSDMAPLPEHIVFIPGFMCDERLFSPQTRQLDHHNQSYRVKTMSSEATLREMALNVLITSPPVFALVGLSMGGIIALEIMRLAPERVSHLALLNTTPYEDKSRRQRNMHLRRARHGNFIDIIKDDLKPRYLSAATRDAGLMALIEDMGQGLGQDVFIRQSIALLVRKSALASLADITCPTLVLTGEDDQLCPPNLHWEMANLIKNSDVKIIPNCGHLSSLETPKAVTEALFLHWGFSRNNLIPFPLDSVRQSELF